MQQRPFRTYARAIAVGLAIAALGASFAATTAASAATKPRPPQGGETYEPRSRPFAIPGFKEQEFDGALLVGKGETRFSMAVNLLTKDGKVLDDNMVPNILKFGPVTPNGEYYEITVTTDDRVLTPARLDALQATIDHPEDWSAEEVANAKAQLPGLQAAYDKKQQDKRTIVIRYARTAAGEIIGAVKALDDDTSVYLQASPPWEEPSTYEHDGARSIVGQSKGLRDASKTGHFRLDTTQTPDSTAGWATVKDMLAGMVGKPAATGNGTAAQRFELSKGETVTFRAEVSDRATKADPLSSKEILRTLDRARAKADDNQLHGNGPIGQATTYMRDAMSLNENYDEKFDRSFIMWGLGGGGDDIFKGWDSGWDGITAASVDPATALDHARDLYDQGGPRYDQLNAGPMHAYEAWRLYTRTGDKKLLELVYPVMTAYIARMPEFDVDKDGLLETPWAGERLGGRGNHLGLDDSPQYAKLVEVPKEGGSDSTRESTNLTDVALNSYYGLFAETLSEMAKALGKPAEASEYAALHDKLAKRMNEHLWDTDRKMYLNRYLDGSFEPTTTPTIFYPLFGGLATPERAKATVEAHLENPAEFGGEYVIPSVARNDPAFCSAGKKHPSAPPFLYFQEHMEEDACEEWKGASWPPMNATVYDGLKRYGLDAQAARLATKSTKMWLTTWNTLGWFPEYFDSEPGQVINSAATDTAYRTYSWSNLMPSMGTNELIGDEPWGDPDGFRFGTAGLPGRNSVEDVPLHGHRYGVEADERTTTLTQDGRRLFRSTGGHVVVRDFVVGRGGGSFTVKASKRSMLTISPKGGRTVVKVVPAGTTKVRW